MSHADQLHHRLQVVNPEDGLMTPFFFRWLVQLYERTGGPTDSIGNIESEILYIRVTDSQLTDLKNKLDGLHIEFEVSPAWQSNDSFNLKLFSKSADFTTYESCIIVATSNITVTLNTNPKDQEKVIIKRATTAGEVTIASSPINVDGAATYKLIMNYEAVQCIYSQPDNAWYIV